MTTYVDLKAWQVSKAGFGQSEGVVLLYSRVDGSIEARSQGYSNEHNQFSFSWSPAVLAIVHTHPNDANPRPSRNDRRLADKLNIPVFTLTNRGMFAYDPATKEVFMLWKNLDWLIPPAGIR